jgi:hypothetical protein
MVTPTQAKRFWVATPQQVETANSMIPGGSYTVTWYYPGKDATARVTFLRVEPCKKSVSVVFAHAEAGREIEIPAQFIKTIIR